MEQKVSLNSGRLLILDFKSYVATDADYIHWTKHWVTEANFCVGNSELLVAMLSCQFTVVNFDIRAPNKLDEKMVAADLVVETFWAFCKAENFK